eukprot:523124-Rhodomonas_salina.5
MDGVGSMSSVGVVSPSSQLSQSLGRPESMASSGWGKASSSLTTALTSRSPETAEQQGRATRPPRQCSDAAQRRASAVAVSRSRMQQNQRLAA